MKISENWLRECVDLEGIDSARLVAALTMAGLEVDTTETRGDDTLIALDLTPNRGDCLGMHGIAREVAAIFDRETRFAEPPAVAAGHDRAFPVAVRNTNACPRYCGRVVTGVDNTRPSPAWLVERLAASGIRSVDAIVDLTNYVMLETGQPLHAFDLARLEGSIVVRDAEAGEKLTLLDGSEVEARGDTLLICDEVKALALAGIMGGEHSGVSATTTSVFLESAHFAPLAIAGKARSYGQSTDSSHRFERGVDPQMPRRALERVTALILEVVGGSAGPLQESCDEERLPRRDAVVLQPARVQRLLEIQDPPEELRALLERLGMSCDQSDETRWLVTPPSWRFDVEREEDLVEEVARIKGYNQVGCSWPAGAMAPLPAPEGRLELPALRRHLAARGYHEAITYSFVAPELQELLEPGAATVDLANPISADMSVMRRTLWAGLLETLKSQQGRSVTRTRLFETGLVFLPGDGELPEQPANLGMLICGERLPRHWAEDGARRSDFHDLKGDLASLFQLTGAPGAFRFTAAPHPALHPGQSARIDRAGQPVGWIGALHPRLLDRLELAGPVLLAEIRLGAVLQRELPRYRSISRQPVVKRDLAVLVEKDLPVQKLIDTIRQAGGDTLHDLTLFDVYQGEGIDKERKSIAFALTFQHPSHTLSEDEVTAVMDQVVAALAREQGAAIRS